MALRVSSYRSILLVHLRSAGDLAHANHIILAALPLEKSGVLRSKLSLLIQVQYTCIPSIYKIGDKNFALMMLLVRQLNTIISSYFHRWNFITLLITAIQFTDTD